MRKQMQVCTLDQEAHLHLTKGKQVQGTLASHFHCAYMIGIILQGEAELTYETTRVKLQAGSYYLMNPFCIHQLRFVRPTDYQVISLKMDIIKRFVGEVQLQTMTGANEHFYESLKEVFQIFSFEASHYIEKQRAIKYLVDLFINEQMLKLY